MTVLSLANDYNHLIFVTKVTDNVTVPMAQQILGSCSPGSMLTMWLLPRGSVKLLALHVAISPNIVAAHCFLNRCYFLCAMTIKKSFEKLEELKAKVLDFVDSLLECYFPLLFQMIN